jgi:diphthamide biosynthesis protein 4
MRELEVGFMDERPDYYQLLGLEHKRTAAVLSSEETKAAYRGALLQHHPDKQSVKPVTDGKGVSVTVDDIALAYKVLSEPLLRAEYDRLVNSQNANGDVKNRVHRTGLETVDLDDLAFDPASSLWSRGCRCGEEKGYIVSESELEKNVEDGELIVGCKGCSLWLRVLFGIEEG